MWHSAGQRNQHRQALCQWLQQNCSACEECNTRLIVMVCLREHKVKEVGMQCDPSPGRRVACNSLSQGGRFNQGLGSQVFQTEPSVIADGAAQ